MAGTWIDELMLAEKRAIEIAIAGETRVAAAEDAARYRDALGCALPLGLPAAFTEPVPRPAGGPRRPLRAHPRAVHRARGRRTPRRSPRRACSAPWPRSRPTGVSCAASSARRACGGSGATPRCCASCGVARWPTLRREVEPVEPAALARFLPAWHGIPAERRGVDAVVEALGLLAGAPIVASTLEVRRALVAGPRLPAGTARRAVHGGRRPLGRRRRHRLGRWSGSSVLRRSASAAGARMGGPGATGRPRCTTRCARCWPSAARASGTQLRAAAPGTADDELLAALWDLVWAGEVTNDSARAAAVLHGSRRRPRCTRCRAEAVPARAG